MSSLFVRCVHVVLKSEGGYQCNPKDPGNWSGGELRGTKYGIAAKYFPSEDIKNLTRVRAIRLYYKYFWLPMNLEGINSEPLVLQVFDMGVNAGRGRAIKALQKIVGAKADGICGPITKGLTNSFKPIEKNGRKYGVLDLYKEWRKHYYINLANRRTEMKVFLKGWLARVERTSL